MTRALPSYPWWIGCLLAALATGWLSGTLTPSRVGRWVGGTSGEPALPADYQRVAVTEPNLIDIGFLQSMHAHHAQAVQMALLVRHRPGAPDIRALADSIAMGQSSEMGLMKGWLTAWGAPIVQVGAAMDWVERAQPFRTVDDALYASRCRAAQGRMPGQASAEELQAMTAAAGSDWESHFLNLMLKHHRAALDMADFAQRYANTDLVKNFAGALIREQHKEIGWIHNRLNS